MARPALVGVELGTGFCFVRAMRSTLKRALKYGEDTDTECADHKLIMAGGVRILPFKKRKSVARDLAL